MAFYADDLRFPPPTKKLLNCFRIDCESTSTIPLLEDNIDVSDLFEYPNFIHSVEITNTVARSFLNSSLNMMKFTQIVYMCLLQHLSLIVMWFYFLGTTIK